MKARTAKRCRTAQGAEGEALPDGRRRKRGPVFVLKPQQVIERCRARHHCDMCAGHVLALMELMTGHAMNISQLAHQSGVGRATISEMLTFKKCPETDTLNDLAETFGIMLIDFYWLSHLSFEAEVSP